MPSSALLRPFRRRNSRRLAQLFRETMPDPLLYLGRATATAAYAYRQPVAPLRYGPRLMVALRLRLGNKAVARGCAWLRLPKKDVVARRLRREWRNPREHPSACLPDPRIFPLAGDPVGCHQLGPVLRELGPLSVLFPFGVQETGQLAFCLPIIVMYRMETVKPT